MERGADAPRSNDNGASQSVAGGSCPVPYGGDWMFKARDFAELNLTALRILKIKTATLLYCGEAMFTASPIRKTTPPNAFHAFGTPPRRGNNDNGASQSVAGGACPVPYGAMY